MIRAAVERHKVIPASYLYLIKGNEILLLHRLNTGYSDGHYSLVSGHVDENETPRLAMAREAKEEAGIEIDPENLELVHVSAHKSHFDGSERLDFFWRCSSWTGEIENKEPEKCDEIAWYNLDKLPSNLVPELTNALEYIKNGQIYSELNWQ